jgi:inner membrane protein
MLFATHILLGITLFLLLAETIGGTVDVFLFVLLGSILPDIDSKGSIINRWSGIIGTFAVFVSKHRGLFHSLLFFLLISGIIGFGWNMSYALGLLVGYAAHMIGDGVTPMGVQLFYPFSSFKIRGPIRVGGILESGVVVVLVVVIVEKLIAL